MKKITLFILSFISVYAFAASNKTQVQGVGHGDYHFGYISAGGGYASLSHNVPDVTTRGSWGALLGAGYEFRMRNAWLNVGCQLMQGQASVTPSEYTYIPCDRTTNVPLGGTDNQIPPQVIEYFQYTIRQKDQLQWRTVDIPIMAGYYNSGFYVGAGFKVGFSTGSSITTSGEYDLAAKYQQFTGLIEHINYYTTYTVGDQKFECNLRPQFSLLGEIGYDVLSSMSSNSIICHMLKVGFYVEYGLNNIRPNDSLDPIWIQGMSVSEAARAEADVTVAHMTPYFLSTKSEGKRVAPFFVGLRLTYLIGGSWSSTKTWHKGCQCYE